MNKGTCKFYNGSWHNTHCLCGVRYADVTTGKEQEPGSAYRKPCVDWSVRKGDCALTPSQQKEWERRGKCDKRQEPTDEEIKAHEQAFADHMVKVDTVAKFLMPIRAEHHGKSHSGVYECPACKGKLHVSIAGYNGHARVMCETKECVRWIE